MSHSQRLSKAWPTLSSATNRAGAPRRPIQRIKDFVIEIVKNTSIVYEAGDNDFEAGGICISSKEMRTFLNSSEPAMRRFIKDAGITTDQMKEACEAMTDAYNERLSRLNIAVDIHSFKEAGVLHREV